ncbi:octaprenyl diphosphate synthase [Corticibacter populi]|uniref:Octaprenyl diphosphate synthase n=1 Tax=Corticibacter populi TaxID=1550736 RepID=A0A3M6QMX3_9BURK|nr:polyprenyl synthetase family protein [Corticibacter populi]RMX04315.1 octaprenyl diphosphate synthase [Corticibacter populi]
MRAVDAVIAQRLATNVPLIGQVAHYIISAGGKRLRPAMLLLVANALQYKGSRHHDMAAVIEFIHTATLLHDDVVDESTMRRGKPTANESFGNPASVLVGDFLHSRAFEMMVETGNIRVMQVVAAGTNIIAEGEVQQLLNMHDASLGEQGYLQVIRSKTAKLFEASTQVAAILAGADAAQERAAAEYGQALGTAFQIIDDVLDYDGAADEMGKNVGDDLREGKATLPLIAAMQRGTAQQAQTVREAIEQGSTAQLTQVIEIVRATGAIEVARQAAHGEAERAIAALAGFPDNAYTEVLRGLSERLLQRRS